MTYICYKSEIRQTRNKIVKSYLCKELDNPELKIKGVQKSLWKDNKT